MMILQFLNYMLQTILSSPITNQFLNHCSGLRMLVLKLEGGSPFTIDDDEEIDFDRFCNSFLDKYVGRDNEDVDDDEIDEDDDEGDKTI